MSDVVVTRPTASMRRAARWHAEERAEAAKHGKALDVEADLTYTHMAACRDCVLRENNDPEFCKALDEMIDALADAEEAGR